MTNHTLEKTQ